jgi:hypothetical protein
MVDGAIQFLVSQIVTLQILIGQRAREIYWRAESRNWKAANINIGHHPKKGLVSQAHK